MVESVYTSDLKSDAPLGLRVRVPSLVLYGVSMFNICVFNKVTKQYIHLDFVEAPSKQEAEEFWKEQNPKRLEILNKVGNFSIVALLEGGGI